MLNLHGKRPKIRPFEFFWSNPWTKCTFVYGLWLMCFNICTLYLHFVFAYFWLYLHIFGSRGHVTLSNKNTLSSICKVTGIKKIQHVIRNCSKLVLLASYFIYNARSCHDWTGQDYLKPWNFHFLVKFIHIMCMGGLYSPLFVETALLFC